ncbi:hypothetical protein BC830DRAFT_51235 [Chytriomyces sp. MP71]|nr:hypothetical protein BC830DRAFT_51235 [Chytriomyces sp. MP71]
MSIPFPSYPAVSLASPLGKGFPTNRGTPKSSSRPSSPQKPRTPNTGQMHSKKPVSAANRSRVEDEYIRNLQQQVYLLELETRYLKTNRGEGGNSGGISPGGGGGHAVGAGGLSGDVHHGSSATLNDAIKGLKSKYIELQENHKRELKKYEDQFERMKTNEQVLELNLQACQKENEELRFELKGIRGNMRKAFSLTPTSKTPHCRKGQTLWRTPLTPEKERHCCGRARTVDQNAPAYGPREAAAREHGAARD